MENFEEKFGLKTEEMDEILGGVVAPVEAAAACGSGCLVMCSSCVGCSSNCTFCVGAVAFL